MTTFALLLLLMWSGEHSHGNLNLQELLVIAPDEFYARITNPLKTEHSAWFEDDKLLNKSTHISCYCQSFKYAL